MCARGRHSSQLHDADDAARMSADQVGVRWRSDVAQHGHVSRKVTAIHVKITARRGTAGSQTRESSMGEWRELARGAQDARMQRTICGGRAVVAEVALVVGIEEEDGLRDAQVPAAAATETTNGEISRNTTFCSTAHGTDVSGQGV